MKLSSLVEKFGLRSKLQTTITVGMAIYELVQSSIWPIYSAAVLASVFHVLCISSEKQIMADHFFGDEKSFEKVREELLTDSKKLFHEELSTAIKERVWQLPERVVRHEYEDRHIA